MTKTSGRSVTRVLGRLALAALLLSAGFGHLTSLRDEFQAQVPSWVPVDPDLVVVASGAVELGLGAAVAVVPRRFRPLVGWVAAAFFVVVFPGNISQYFTHADAFGLDSDRARLLRLVFQPVLVAWALWSTGAWRAWRRPGATAQRHSPFVTATTVRSSRWHVARPPKR